MEFSVLLNTIHQAPIFAAKISFRFALARSETFA